jgi:PhnB protein
MQTKLNPYISFQGNAREAMEFYESVFGGKLELTTFKEGGMPATPETENHIMHAMLVSDGGLTLMGSDAPEVGGYTYQKGTNISISLSGDNEAELTGYFEKLSAGGEVAEPLVKAPWGDTFGMVTDKFGIFWMVNITAAKGE